MIPGAQPTPTGNPLGVWDTLDEPIIVTLKRDVSSIVSKLKLVFWPKSEADIYLNLYKNWECYGVMLFTTYIAFATSTCKEECDGYHTSNFSSNFVLLWLGIIAICLNYMLLMTPRTLQAAANTTADFGAVDAPIRRLSFFQLICSAGYCLSIPATGLLFVEVIALLAGRHSHLFRMEKALVSLIFGLIWPALSCSQMLSIHFMSNKSFLIFYPIALYFSVLSLYMFTFA